MVLGFCSFVTVHDCTFFFKKGCEKLNTVFKDCVRIIHPGWSYNRGESSLLSFRCNEFFIFPSLSPFLICTSWLTIVTPLVLLTDSSSSTALPVIKSCHSYRGERMEKCTPVAGHRGSQVDTLTKLEEDTEMKMYSEHQWWKVHLFN